MPNLNKRGASAGRRANPAAAGHLNPSGTGYGLSRQPHAGSDPRLQQNNRASISGRGTQGFGMPPPAATSTMNPREGRSGRNPAPSRGTNAPMNNQVSTQPSFMLNVLIYQLFVHNFR